MSREPVVSAQFSLAFVSFLMFGITAALFFHLPAFLQDLGAKEVTIGAILGAGSVGSLATRGLIGRALDNVGRKPLIVAGHVVNVGAILLHLTITAIDPWVYVVTLLLMLAQALLFTSIITFSSDVVPAGRRAEGLALFGVSGQAPLAIGGVMGDIILSRGGFTELFLIAAGIGFVGLIAALPLIDQMPTRERASQGSVRLAIKARRLRPLWLISLVFAITLTSFVTFLKTYVADVGYGTVGAFFAAYSTTAIILRVAGNRVLGVVSNERILRSSVVAMALGTALLAQAKGPAWIVAAGVAAGAGHGYLFPVLNAAVVDRAPDRDRGSALSVFVAFFPLGVIVGGPLLGWLIEAFGYPTMYWLVSVMLVSAATVFGPLDRTMAAATNREAAAGQSVQPKAGFRRRPRR